MPTTMQVMFAISVIFICFILIVDCVKPRAKKNFVDLSRRQQLRRLEILRQADLAVVSHAQAHVVQDVQQGNEHLAHSLNTSSDTESLQRDDEPSNLDLNDLELPEPLVIDAQNFPVDFDNENDEPEQSVASKLKNFLRFWHLKNKITQSATTELLHGLQTEGSIEGLPLTAKSLVETPRHNTNIRALGTGLFSYYGIERALIDQMQYIDVSKILTDLYIYVHVDGLRISKSSKNELWPILGRIIDNPALQPFVIAIFSGSSKPQSLHEFLADFMAEYVVLHNEGFIYRNYRFKLHIKAFLADTLARNFLLSFPAHNSRCARCIQEGVTRNYRRLFLEIDSELRTDLTFRTGLPTKFRNALSPLESIHISMTRQFPLDYMHLLCLGVMKKLLGIWISELRPPQLDWLNQFYTSFAASVPAEFVRKPRSFDEINFFKATEFRLFLLYLGPIVVRLFLSKARIIHFYALNCAVRILCDPKKHITDNQYAHELLVYFVEMMKVDTLYGEENLIFNVHNLIHVSHDVSQYGPLDAFSCFPFENHLGIMRNLIQSGKLPLSQIMNRVQERSKFLPSPASSLTSGYRIFGKKKTSQLHFGYENAFQFVQFPTFKLSIHPPDNCCMLKDQTIVFIQHICYQNRCPVIVGRKVVNSDSLEDYPCDSREVGIFKVTEWSEELAWSIDQIQQKGFSISTHDCVYVLPIIHADN